MNFIATRRKLLVGLAAASTAAAAPTANAKNPSECSTLLELGDALPPLAEQQRAANAAYNKMTRDAAPVWPRAGDDILGREDGSDIERDITGRGYGNETDEDGKKKFKPFGGYICTREGVKSRLRSHRKELARIEGKPRKKGRTALLKESIIRDETIVTPQVEKYWSECERLKVKFRAEEIIDQAHATREALHAHVNAIMTTRETSMTGVIIKAQALEAWGNVPKFFQLFNPEGRTWALEMSAAIMRQAEATS